VDPSRLKKVLKARDRTRLPGRSTPRAVAEPCPGVSGGGHKPKHATKDGVPEPRHSAVPGWLSQAASRTPCVSGACWPFHSMPGIDRGQHPAGGLAPAQPSAVGSRLPVRRGVEYLDEYDPEGQPLRRIQLRSPPHRVAGIDRHDEIQSKNLELRRGRCKRRRERS
jgi:hypothetical protein